MLTIRLDLSDEMKRELEARVQDGAYSSIEDYVRGLLEADLDAEAPWEMTPELAAALAEGEASGIDPRSIQEIIADCRKRRGL